MGFKKRKGRGKPYPIQFARVTLRNVTDLAEWCGGEAEVVQTGTAPDLQAEPRLRLRNLPEIMQGDYVVKYHTGGFETLRADLFEEFFEAV